MNFLHKCAYTAGLGLLTLSPLAASSSTVPASTFGTLNAAELALVGPDQNSNGVRDDIDAWVAKTYPDPESRDAVLAEMQWLTWSMLRGYRGTATTQDELNNMSNAMSCAFEQSARVFGESGPKAGEIEAAIFNTYPRTKAYLAWNASIDGTVIASDADPCETKHQVSRP